MFLLGHPVGQCLGWDGGSDWLFSLRCRGGQMNHFICPVYQYKDKVTVSANMTKSFFYKHHQLNVGRAPLDNKQHLGALNTFYDILHILFSGLNFRVNI